MRLGKLNNFELKQYIFDVLKTRRPEVITRAGQGIDCTSFFANGIISVSTDPITGATDKIGSLSVMVGSNDIYCAGATPVIILLTIILPTDFPPLLIKNIMQDAENAAHSLNIEIAGGHTEFSDAVNRPIISATCIGISKTVLSGKVAVGDSIIITKNIALEGTAILAETEAAAKILSPTELAEAQQYFEQISIAKEGIIAMESGASCLHDITEGGILSALSELIEATDVRLDLDISKIPITPLTKKLTTALKIDPYRLISSGSLIVSTSNAPLLIERLKNAHINAAIVGTITKGNGVYAVLPDGISYKIDVSEDKLFAFLKDNNKNTFLHYSNTEYND